MVFNVSESEERITIDAKKLPFEVVKLENIQIPARDGALLYAHVWIPKIALGDSLTKVGTLVEYLPYRKNDFTSIRDSIRHPYYAGYGFASMRIDMRGCGDSDGELLGEYLLQEQLDNLDIFDWIVKQSWSNGNIGQIGKSWGGFNGLQVAYMQHPNLKAIISTCSTDDRYADDVHYRGGCILASDMLWWASTMFVYNARPQDPHIRDDWRENWIKRLALEPNIVEWMKHQRRDEFWKHGSVCEDFNKVDIPVLAVGGWKDGYTDAIFRMVENLPNKESKGLIGPWVHEFPEVATPSPAIGYNQIVVKWFSKYLNTDDSISKAIESVNIDDSFDIGKLNNMNVFIQEPSSISESYEKRSGKWVSVDYDSGAESLTYHVDTSNLSLSTESVKNVPPVTFSGKQEYGLLRGTWCPFGQDGDFAADQKIEDAKSFCLDGEPLKDDYNLFGFPVVQFVFSSDSELANVSVRLVDLNSETGENYLVSWGIANLNHYIGTHESPKKLVVGEKYKVSINLDSVGYIFKKGHRVRIAFSTTDWPSMWPSAKNPNITLYPETSLQLPLLSSSEMSKHDISSLIPQAESMAPTERDILREESRSRKIVYDPIHSVWEIDDFSDEGKRRIVSNNMELGSTNHNSWRIKENCPLSAFNKCDWELTLSRTDENWSVKILTESTMEADESNFYLKNKLTAYEGEKSVFEREWNDTISRDFT